MTLALLVLSFATPPMQQPPEVIDRHPIKGGRVLMTYEVRDLLPEVAPPKGVTWSSAEWEEQGRRVRQPSIDLLTELITREVQPPVDSKVWELRITPNGTVVLHAEIAQHQWLMQFFERNRTRETFVVLETTWIEGPKGSFQRMGIPGGASASAIEAKDRERLLALEKGDPRFSVRTSPSLSLRLLAVGNLGVTEPLAYVKDFKLQTVQPGNMQIADPEIAVIDEGLEIRSQAALLDGQRIALSIEATTTAVRRPIPTRSYRLAPDIPTEVTIAMPEVDRNSIQARCTLAPDGTLAFCAPIAGKDEREVLILVRANTKTAVELQAPPAVPVQPR